MTKISVAKLGECFSARTHTHTHATHTRTHARTHTCFQAQILVFRFPVGVRESAFPLTKSSPQLVKNEEEGKETRTNFLVWKAYTSHDGWEKIVVFWSNSRKVVVGFVSLSWLFLFIYFLFMKKTLERCVFRLGVLWQHVLRCPILLYRRVSQLWSLGQVIWSCWTVKERDHWHYFRRPYQPPWKKLCLKGIYILSTAQT